MTTKNQIVYQTADRRKDLLVFDRATGEVTVKAYELTREELQQLCQAAAHCLSLDRPTTPTHRHD